MHDENHDIGAAFSSRYRYERPDLELIELNIEGSFLGSSSHPGNFNDTISIDDEETDDFD